MILGGLRDGKPPAAVRQECRRGPVATGDALRRSPTTSDCSAEYEGVVGKLCGRQCPGIHHYLVRINPLT
jgi:hypothetical protein